MKKILVVLLVGLALCSPLGQVFAQKDDELPTGDIARGQISEVPTGDLFVGVLDKELAIEGSGVIGGPPGFLVNGDMPVEIAEIEGGKALRKGEALFLPSGTEYRIANKGDKEARIRFVGFGGSGAVKGATYEMLPVPRGPGAGKMYNVTLSRNYYSGESSTSWHYHKGPAFGILDTGGMWENRQQDGSTRRIPTPGYYVQPALAHHQLAQVGNGGYALVIQFAPPGQGLTGGSDARSDKTPTTLVMATPIPGFTPEPLPTAHSNPAAQGTVLTGAPASEERGSEIGVWALAATVLVGIVVAMLWRVGRRSGTGA